MIELHPRYMVDEEGNRTAVVLEIAEYEELLEELERQDAIRSAADSFQQGWREAQAGNTQPVSKLWKDASK